MLRWADEADPVTSPERALAFGARLRSVLAETGLKPIEVRAQLAARGYPCGTSKFSNWKRGENGTRTADEARALDAIFSEAGAEHPGLYEVLYGEAPAPDMRSADLRALQHHVKEAQLVLERLLGTPPPPPEENPPTRKPRRGS